MSESLRNDGRDLGAEEAGRRPAPAARHPRGRARLLPRAQLPELRQPGAARHRLARRQGRLRRGPRRRPEVAASRGVYLDFADAIERLGGDAIEPQVRQPLRHVRADHRREPVRGADAHLPRRALHDGRPVGRLQPDVDDPGPVRARRGQLLRPRRQPPRRLRADAGPGRRLLRAAATRSATTSPTARSRRSPRTTRRSSRRARRCETRIEQLPRRQRQAHASTPSTASSATSCGTTAAWRATRRACAKAIDQIRELREEFWRNVKVPGAGETLNQALEKAGRVADFIELGELMCRDALDRRESCGGHFREESQTEDGEALRDDDEFAYVAAWEWAGRDERPGAAQGRPRVSTARRDEAAELQVMNLTLQDLAPGRTPTDRGRDRRPTSSTTSSPDMSFLEMLDVVNEQLIAAGRGADRLRPRLPRGHLRHVRRW